MRILDVSPRAGLPADTGGAVRAYNLLLHLSRRHEIRQFCLGELPLRPWTLRRVVRETPVTPTFRVVTYASPLTELVVRSSERLWDSRSAFSGKALRAARPTRLRELLGWADLVLVEAPWQFAYVRSERPDARLVLASHNVERERFVSYAALRGNPPDRDRRVRGAERLEAEAIAGSSLTVAVSPEDRLEFIERYGADPERVIVVRSGADTEKYHPVDAEVKAARKRELGLPTGPTVVFVGSRFVGNRMGLDWIHRLGRATDRFTYLVVGSIARPGRRGSVHATGHVDDVAPYLEAADVAVCPIQYGAGVKTKLLEALAAGLPTVAFAESLNGTELRDGEHLLVAEKSERELLAALERLADDSELAGRLGAAGRAFIAERHDWGKAAATLEAALLELVGFRELRLTYRSPTAPGDRATI